MCGVRRVNVLVLVVRVDYLKVKNNSSYRKTKDFFKKLTFPVGDVAAVQRHRLLLFCWRWRRQIPAFPVL